jgi:hypothetical protein
MIIKEINKFTCIFIMIKYFLQNINIKGNYRFVTSNVTLYSKIPFPNFFPNLN